MTAARLNGRSAVRRCRNLRRPLYGIAAKPQERGRRFLANEQYRPARDAGEAFCDTSQKQATNASASMSSDNNEVSAPGKNDDFYEIVKCTALRKNTRRQSKYR